MMRLSGPYLPTEKNVSLNFRRDYDKLKKLVSQTGLDGRWKKLASHTRQYITDDGGVLNWHPSKGSVWFQGEDEAAKELERKCKKAAKGRVERRGSAQQKLSKGKSGTSDSRKALRRLSKKISRFERKLIDQFGDLNKRYRNIEEKLKWLDGATELLLVHFGIFDSDDREVNDDENDDDEIAQQVKPQLRLVAKGQSERSGIAGARSGYTGKNTSGSDIDVG
jgi:hypothetical protein